MLGRSGGQTDLVELEQIEEEEGKGKGAERIAMSAVVSFPAGAKNVYAPGVRLSAVQPSGG